MHVFALGSLWSSSWANKQGAALRYLHVVVVAHEMAVVVRMVGLSKSINAHRDSLLSIQGRIGSFLSFSALFAVTLEGLGLVDGV